MAAEDSDEPNKAPQKASSVPATPEVPVTSSSSPTLVFALAPPAVPSKPASNVEVLARLKEWKEWIVLIFATVTALIVAWNSKANTSDLEQVRAAQLRQEELIKTVSADVKRLEDLRGDLRHLTSRVDTLHDQPLAPQSQGSPPATP
jgi:uncharacterized coiled-coil protein SlyX